jgi:WD40 repeat protein
LRYIIYFLGLLLFLDLVACDHAQGPYAIGSEEAPGTIDRTPPNIEVSGIATHFAGSGKEKAINFVGHNKRVTSLAFSEDGDTLVSGSSDGTVRMWAAATGEERRILRGHSGGVQAVAVSPDGRYIASGGWDKRIILWSAVSGKKIRRLRGHRAGISALAFAANGQRLVSGSFDGSLHMWDVESGDLLGKMIGHRMAIQAVAVSPTENIVASAGADRDVHLWDTDDLGEIRRLKGHEGMIKALAFSPDGLFLLSGGADDRVFVWNLDDEPENRLVGDSFHRVNALSVSSDGRRFLATDHEKIELWDLETGSSVATAAHHQGLVTAAVFSPSSGKVASSDDDGHIRIWEAPSGAIAAKTGWIETTDQIITVSGSVTDDSLLSKVRVDDENLIISANGSFRFDRRLLIGENRFSLVAIDKRGNKTEYELRVERQVKAARTEELPPVDPFKHSGSRNRDDVAVIIGVENYAKIPVAEFAGNDAKVFFDFATNVLGVPQARTKLLVDQDATRNEILKTFSNWLKSTVIPGDSRVYVFFSGHGTSSADGLTSYLLPVDGDPSLLDDTAISRDRFWQDLSDANAASVTVFLDTCYSGVSRSGEALTPGTRGVIVRERPLAGLPSNLSVLSAASLDEVSIGLKERSHGLFSYYLMRALEGEADEPPHGNGNGELTLDEIIGYVRPNVRRTATKDGHKQTPQLIGTKETIVARW